MRDQKITSDHLRKAAYLYVRQSSMKQVIENQESTQRQYALKNRALALGWKLDQIIVIDEDLGLSGTSVQDRKGFQRLVAEVGLANVGLVMGLEVSRLARNNTDWHHLLEICALTDTLLLDEDGLYDPGFFNDRLLLGLKGAMSEAEIHFLRARLQGGILNKAKRGELKMRLPVGFVYDDSGKTVIDPNRQVKEAVEHLFSIFKRTGSAYAVVKHFRENGLKFPAHVRSGPHEDEIVWKPLYHYRVLQVLHNPRYTGTFVFGQTKTRKNPIDGKTRTQNIPPDQWKVIIPEVFEGYISWEQYQNNQKQLANNAAAHNKDQRRSPPGSGPALIQGMVLCGKCGQRMTVRYHTRNGELVPDYVCQRQGIETATRQCQFVQGEPVDELIGKMLVEMVTPLNLDVSMKVFEEIRTRHEDLVRLHRTGLERARHEAELAQRRFIRVNPDNRLVADSLESRWNEALRTVTELEEKYKCVIAEYKNDLTSEKVERIRKLAEDFPTVWNDPRTSAKERKRMVRLLIEDVTLLKTDVIHVNVRFKGGDSMERCVSIPPVGWKIHQTSTEVIEQIREMAPTKTDSEITDELNQQQLRSSTGLSFTRRRVYMLRRDYDIAGPYEHLREQGFLTAEELADRIGVYSGTVKRWGKAGILKSRAYNDRGMALYEDPGENLPNKWAKKKSPSWRSKQLNVTESMEEVQYEV
ncbi:MAG: recombinase family protein [Methanosarcinales archaeon]|nr:recombinase family protein [Methanosarcinales archaeon]